MQLGAADFDGAFAFLGFVGGFIGGFIVLGGVLFVPAFFFLLGFVGLLVVIVGAERR